NFFKRLMYSDTGCIDIIHDQNPLPCKHWSNLIILEIKRVGSPNTRPLAEFGLSPGLVCGKDIPVRDFCRLKHHGSLVVSPLFHSCGGDRNWYGHIIFPEAALQKHRNHFPECGVFCEFVPVEQHLHFPRIIHHAHDFSRAAVILREETAVPALPLRTVHETMAEAAPLPGTPQRKSFPAWCAERFSAFEHCYEIGFLLYTWVAVQTDHNVTLPSLKFLMFLM